LSAGEAQGSARLKAEGEKMKTGFDFGAKALRNIFIKNKPTLSPQKNLT
jgi:hypothetical protein